MMDNGKEGSLFLMENTWPLSGSGFKFCSFANFTLTSGHESPHCKLELLGFLERKHTFEFSTWILKGWKARS